MKKMYKGKVNSPATLLVETIDSSVTSIKVADGAVFPEGPNVAVIGTDGNAETIKYDSINGNILVGCVRGFQGKASVWDKDTIIARNFTEYDLDALQENILELDDNKVDKAPGQGLISDSEKNKLANIEAEANKYVHPSSHPASMITETSSKRFVSDAEKEKWNNKIDKSQIVDDAYGRESDKVVSQKGITFMRLDLLRELQNKANSSQIPKKLSQLENDKTFKTEAEIQELINNSTKLKKEVVTSLPTTGKEDVIYLLKNKNDTNNYYTEYMWISGRWEIIGDTKVDLTGYLKTTDLKNAKLRTNKNSIHVFTDRSKSETDLDIILGDLELRTEQNKKNIKTKLSEMEEDSTHKTVTDSEKQSWNNKVDKVSGKGLSTNDYDATAKSKVDAIPANPKYTDTTYSNATTSSAGLMSAADKVKLNGLGGSSDLKVEITNGDGLTFYKYGKVVVMHIFFKITQSLTSISSNKKSIPANLNPNKDLWGTCGIFEAPSNYKTMALTQIYSYKSEFSIQSKFSTSYVGMYCIGTMIYTID